MTKKKTNQEISLDNKNTKTESPMSFLDESDVFKILLSQMKLQQIQMKEQEIAIVKEKALALLEGEEKERARVSREIHDSIGQMLTAIKLVTNSIKGQDELKLEIKNMIDETISEARRISFDLMPSVLLNFGLISSVKILCENAVKYGCVNVDQYYDETILSTTISLEKSITLYRIIQEAFNNILKHAKAKNIIIKIENNLNNINVLIIDDGIGFTVNKNTNSNKGKGLYNMLQRSELSGGQFFLESNFNKGTKIKVVIPI